MRNCASFVTFRREEDRKKKKAARKKKTHPAMTSCPSSTPNLKQRMGNPLSLSLSLLFIFIYYGFKGTTS